MTTTPTAPPTIAASSGAFFVWVVIALGVTAISSFILSAYGLWGLQRGQAGSPTTRTA